MTLSVFLWMVFFQCFTVTFAAGYAGSHEDADLESKYVLSKSSVWDLISATSDLSAPGTVNQFRLPVNYPSFRAAHDAGFGSRTGNLLTAVHFITPLAFISANRRSEDRGFKSKTRGRLYSAGFTIAPLLLARGVSEGYRYSEQTDLSLLLITAGLLVGPSSGSLYADDWTLARQSILMRYFSSVFYVSGYVVRDRINEHDYELIDGLGRAMQITGSLFLAAHALYDILFLSAHSVDFYNFRLRMEVGLIRGNPNQVDQNNRQDILSQTQFRHFPALTLHLHF